MSVTGQLPAQLILLTKRLSMPTALRPAQIPLKYSTLLPIAAILCCSPSLIAQTPTSAGAKSANVRILPPVGIEVSVADRADLERNLATLKAKIAELAERKDAKTKSLLPDVAIFSRAVESALQNNEFFATGDIAKAQQLLKIGTTRAEQLRTGQPEWTQQMGLIPRGYVSRIDGSVQPFGVVVPDTYQPVSNAKYRLDIWLHGRNEKLSEINFLDERQKQAGQFTPADTIVLHVYGRYCNAFKFAGEIDVLEALDAVKRQYHIDEDRVAMRGFSMGGAGCWHLAVHYTDHWVVATPGAGFAETEEYLKLTPAALDALPDWQRKLFHWYDCPDWAGNLYQCPTIAYNGADDPQKQAADVMEKALEKEGISLKRIIGPGTKHAYHPDSKKEIEAAVDSIVELGRDRHPPEVHFTTYTLRYNQMFWVHVEGLAEHWQESRVDAIATSADEQTVIAVDSKNVTDLTLSFPPGWAPFDITKPVQVAIDDQELDAPRALSDRSWTCHLHRGEADGDVLGQWQMGPRDSNGLRKRPGLQGPIDDAFMDAFIIVRPTGKSSRAAVSGWVQAEMDRAIREWRLQFRGEPRVKDDTAVTDDDIASANLILWGDAESNSVIKRIADQLPIRWQQDNILMGRDKYTAVDHVPVMIYPNPLNSNRYVVLNSGFTFREGDYGSNARQVPRLPDWAIIDIRTPHDANRPGKIEAANFFGEKWELNPAGAKPDKNKTANAKGPWHTQKAPVTPVALGTEADR